jgi:hypothetical protein
VPLVLRTAADIGLGLSGLRSQSRCLLDRAGVQRLASECLLGSSALNVVRPYTGERDTCPVDRATRALQVDGHADRREVSHPPLELEVRPRTRSSRRRHSGPDRDLPLLQGVLERPDHKLRHWNGALAAVSVPGDDFATQRQHRRRPVSLRISVAERADQRSPVTNHGVGDERCDHGHDGILAPEKC